MYRLYIGNNVMTHKLLPPLPPLLLLLLVLIHLANLHRTSHAQQQLQSDLEKNWFTKESF